MSGLRKRAYAQKGNTMNKQLKALAKRIAISKTSKSYKEAEEKGGITCTDAFVSGMRIGTKAKTKKEKADFVNWWLNNMC